MHKSNDQERPQTARRNLTHQQSVEGEVQLRCSSQAFQSSNSSKQNVHRGLFFSFWLFTSLHDSSPPSSPLMFLLIQSFKKCIPSRSQVDLLTKIRFKMWCSVIFRIIRKTALSLVLIPFSYEIVVCRLHHFGLPPLLWASSLGSTGSIGAIHTVLRIVDYIRLGSSHFYLKIIFLLCSHLMVYSAI